MIVKPILDHILILPLEETEKRASGLYIPETAKEKPQKGKVIEVGPGKFVNGILQKLGVKKGDVVIFKRWGGEDLTIDGKEYKLVKEEDVLAILIEK